MLGTRSHGTRTRKIPWTKCLAISVSNLGLFQMSSELNMRSSISEKWCLSEFLELGSSMRDVDAYMLRRNPGPRATTRLNRFGHVSYRYEPCGCDRNVLDGLFACVGETHLSIRVNLDSSSTDSGPLLGRVRHTRRIPHQLNHGYGQNRMGSCRSWIWVPTPRQNDKEAGLPPFVTKGTMPANERRIWVCYVISLYQSPTPSHDRFECPGIETWYCSLLLVGKPGDR